MSVLSIRFWTCVAVMALSACDLDPASSVPTSACTETGAQCVLPTGPLGVCERMPCADGADEPCFVCTSQH